MASRVSLPADMVDDLHKALEVLTRTVVHVLQDQAVEAALGEGVAYSKVQVLRLLSHRGAQTSSQIARFLGVRRPSVTQIADTLEQAGWITRSASKRDGRESMHTLSDEGRQKFNAVRRQQRHLLRNMLRLAGEGCGENWTETLHGIAVSLARSDRAFKEYCLQCGAHADNTCVLVGGDATCPFLHRGQTAKPKSIRKSR